MTPTSVIVALWQLTLIPSTEFFATKSAPSAKLLSTVAKCVFSTIEMRTTSAVSLRQNVLSTKKNPTFVPTSKYLVPTGVWRKQKNNFSMQQTLCSKNKIEG
jgi:hypothetical protein